MSEFAGLGGGRDGKQGPAFWYVFLVILVAAVNDGWSGRPSPFAHQIILLPFTAAFATVLFWLLRRPGREDAGRKSRVPVRFGVGVCLAFELLSICSFLYARHHFARFGYGFGPVRAGIFLALVIVAGITAATRRTGQSVFGAVLVAYGAGLLLAIRSFPLNYLRSDMLPVIFWSDRRLISGLNPYATMHVGSRLYDFPYLPGMLVAYLPAIALHLDVRFMNLVCVAALAWLVYWTARLERRLEAAVLTGVFLLSPFLQYRHDLYLAPHWLALAGAFVLMQRHRYIWAAAVFGVGMAVYQLSWILFPFFLLNALWRRGWLEALKLGLIGIGGMLVVLAPFLSVATRRIANNTVGQWSRLPHAIADPINLSYWVTFLIRPDQLRWVQLAAMTAIFAFCLLRGRCGTFEDMLRWMAAALALFIALNVLVDGYFYLTLLLLLLMYTFAASDVWKAAVGAVPRIV